MTRLYIVEGLPCSGKSTTAKHIADLLEKSDKKVYFLMKAAEIILLIMSIMLISHRNSSKDWKKPCR